MELVDFIISGKCYPKVPKYNLTQNSEYFKALFSGNYRDSSVKCLRYHGFSSTAFDIILKYVATKKISMIGKKTILQFPEETFELVGFFCIDSFEDDLVRTLYESYLDFDFSIVAPLARRLRIEDQLIEHCLNAVEDSLKPGNFDPVCTRKKFNYSALILATGFPKFWSSNLEQSNAECYERLWRFQSILEDVLTWAVQNPPQIRKMRDLLTNLNLESLPWDNVRRLVRSLPCEPVQKKCLRLAVQNYFSNLQENIAQKLSRVRVTTLANMKGKGECLVILEFNLYTWTWEVKKVFKSKNPWPYCFMSRDYANFMGESGLMIFRMKNLEPKFVKHIYIGEIMKNLCDGSWRIHDYLATCNLKNFIFLLAQHPLPDEYEGSTTPLWYSTPTLFKMDVFSYEFYECTSLQLVHANMIGHDKYIYIAGVSVDDGHEFSVIRYNTLSGETDVIASMNNFEESLPSHLVIKKRNLYIFYGMRFLIVNTRTDEHEELKFHEMEGFLTQLWKFSILQAVAVSDGVMFILDIKHTFYNCIFLGLMLAHLNTDSLDFKSCGFLPNLTDPYSPCLLYDPLHVQIEERKPSKPFTKMHALASGIEDL